MEKPLEITRKITKGLDKQAGRCYNINVARK
jgi:hypothetical protein